MLAPTARGSTALALLTALVLWPHGEVHACQAGLTLDTAWEMLVVIVPVALPFIGAAALAASILLFSLPPSASWVRPSESPRAQHPPEEVIARCGPS
jgi:hypothetical protein